MNSHIRPQSGWRGRVIFDGVPGIQGRSALRQGRTFDYFYVFAVPGQDEVYITIQRRLRARPWA